MGLGCDRSNPRDALFSDPMPLHKSLEAIEFKLMTGSIRGSQWLSCDRHFIQIRPLPRIKNFISPMLAAMSARLFFILGALAALAECQVPLFRQYSDCPKQYLEAWPPKTGLPFCTDMDMVSLPPESACHARPCLASGCKSVSENQSPYEGPY